MAYASVHHHTQTGGILGSLRNAFTALRAAWERSRVYANTYNELAALSDRDLHDLGISRSEIKRLAYEAAYGKDD
ncbi:MAG: DUF1127 domain-containing protein [Alphaproteobacteria bacterium]|nr:MAG: DUF1127 domain-containing protein [Alphaproteobacteria bacterium]